MRLRPVALISLALITASVWWFWPLIAWFQLGDAARSAFGARNPVTKINLADPPESWGEIHFGPIAVSLPMDEIRNGFCLDKYPTCDFNLKGYSVVFDIEWPERTNRQLASGGHFILQQERSTPQSALLAG